MYDIHLIIWKRRRIIHIWTAACSVEKIVPEADDMEYYIVPGYTHGTLFTSITDCPYVRCISPLGSVELHNEDYFDNVASMLRTHVS